MKLGIGLAAMGLLGMTLAARADLLLSDYFNYSDGSVETDGVWFAYTPALPHGDAFVTNHWLILNQAHYDGVAAPFTNSTGSTIVYASFNFNVSALPTSKGGYFCQFMDNTNNAACRLFISAANTIVPGTYRLGVNNYSSSYSSASWFPLDLATDITYQVVLSFDIGSTLPGATLYVNPASEADFDTSTTFGKDTTTSPALLNIQLSRIAFSQYTSLGISTIGSVRVGSTYSDVITNGPLAPVIGIQPQGASLYSGNSVTLDVVASGTEPLSYHWLANGVPLSDSGTISGSTSNVLTLGDLQSTADYRVVVTNSAGSVTSLVATVSVNTTPTMPFFTLQPQGQTNAVGSTITLTAAADGTSPISYQWYFEATNSSTFTALSSGPTLTLSSVTFADSGLYYVTATGGAGSSDSATVTVLVQPPPLVSISYLHGLMPRYFSGNTNLNGTAMYRVQGVVTSFAPFSATGATYAEFYIQDATGGIYVYAAGRGSNSVPPAGALVSVTGTVQVYGGQLEINPNAANTNSISVLADGQPLPASTSLNLAMMATNPLSSYGIQAQDSLVTVTNVYIYSSSTGAAVSGNFPTNEAKTLYLFAQPYGSGAPYLVLYFYGSNGEATNFWGQPIPSYAYEITGIMGQYHSTAEIYPTRYADLVTTLPSPFSVSLSVTNGVFLSWPTLTGSTYSVLSATNLLGPWTQMFGLGYYPSLGAYTDTNSAPAKFYRVCSP